MARRWSFRCIKQTARLYMASRCRGSSRMTLLYTLIASPYFYAAIRSFPFSISFCSFSVRTLNVISTMLESSAYAIFPLPSFVADLSCRWR
jgi:hypothetical protein